MPVSNLRDAKAVIKTINHLNSRILISDVFKLFSEASLDGVDEELLGLKKFWKENKALEADIFNEKVGQTMVLAREYFSQNGLEVESLDANGPFAKHMETHSKASTAACAKVMEDFCKYLCFVSKENIDNQTTCFASFPPEIEYLNCLDGSEERIEELTMGLVVGHSTHKHWLDAHKLVMNEYRNKASKTVVQVNETHITKYLEHSLGIRPDQVLHPESQMPIDTLWEMHVDYSEKLKSRIQEKLDEIDDIIANLQKDFSDHNLEKFEYDLYLGENNSLYAQINKRLKPYKIDDNAFIDFVIEDGGSYCKLNYELIDQAKKAIYEPIIEFLETSLEGKEHLSDYTYAQDYKILCDSAHNNKMFNEEELSSLQTLLEQNSIPRSEHPYTYNDLTLAFEAFSIIASQCGGNSPAIFSRLDNYLTSVNTGNYLSTMQTILDETGLHHGRKINSIQARLNEIQRSPDIECGGILSFRDLDALLISNAENHMILKNIRQRSAESLVEENKGINSLLIDEDKQDAIYGNLSNRPDRLEIMGAIINKINTYNANKKPDQNSLEIPQNFIKFCLNAASFREDTTLCKLIVDNITVNEETFNQGSFLNNSVALKNKELVDLFLDKHATLFADETTRQERLLYCISEKPQNAITNNPTTGPIAIALKYGNLSFIEKVSERGINLEQIDLNNVVNGFNILHIAAFHNQKHIVKYLVDWGVDVNKEDIIGNNVAHYAAKHGSIPILELLKNSDYKTENFTKLNNESFDPLNMAIRANKKDAITFIGKILQEKMPESLNLMGDNTYIHALLIKSFQQNNTTLLDLIPTFQEIGIDINRQNSNGSTPLHIATMKGNRAMIEELIKCGAKTDINDKYDRIPSFYATHQNRPDLVEAIFCTQNRKDLNSVLHLSCTPLMLLELDDQESNCLLPSLTHMNNIFKHHKLNAQRYHDTNKDGDNPITIAAKNVFRLKNENKKEEHDESMHEVIEAEIDTMRTNLSQMKEIPGFSFDNTNKEGKTPICLLATSQSDNTEVEAAIELLQSEGANIDCPNQSGDTALHIAVKENNLSALRILMKAGADPLMQDQSGNTVISNISSHNRDYRFSQEIIKAGYTLESGENNIETPEIVRRARGIKRKRELEREEVPCSSIIQQELDQKGITQSDNSTSFSR